VRVGESVSEMEVEMMETDEGWSPYLSLEDAYKLYDICAALRRDEIRVVDRLVYAYTLTPVASRSIKKERGIWHDNKCVKCRKEH